MRAARFLMGGPWEVIAWGPPDVCREAVGAAIQEVARIESLMNFFDPASEIVRINRHAGRGWIPVSPEVCGVVAEGLRYAQWTAGAFDPASGALKDLWGFGPEGSPEAPPEPSRIREMVRAGGYRRVRVDERSSGLMIEGPGVQLDLGGIGKGYAVDRAAEVLMAHGVRKGWVSCGSSGFALDPPPGGDGWRVGIRDPGRPDRVARVITIRNRAFATSGTYEQVRGWNGRRFTHVHDPRTGYPITGTAGVTVTAPTAMMADAISTAALVLGREAGSRFLAERKGVEGCFVEDREEGGLSVTTTPGWGGVPVGMDRRRFLLGLAAAIGFLMIAPPRAGGEVLMMAEDALRSIFPESREFRKEIVTLTADQKDQAYGILGRRMDEETYTFYKTIGPDPVGVAGYGVALDVIGKERPITFLVGVSPQGRIIGLEVLIYRESEGSEIRSSRFRRQFTGKSIESPPRLGSDIHGITGATLSSRSAAYAVKKGLALIRVVYGVGAEKGL
ncbi:MAG: FAD:protein FMN transferase [Nitrospirae bacterium]|nr:FAD:protein FMN transferase [Nitrospirota bacterium]